MHPLAHAPEVPLEEVIILDGGVFPGDDDLPLVLRDLPVAVIDPPWDDLAEALAGVGGQESREYVGVVGSEFVQISVLLYDPYVSFKFKLPLEDWKRVRAADDFLGVTTPQMVSTGTLLLQFALADSSPYSSTH